MKNAKVIKIDGNSLEFDNGLKLFSEHEQECCENHYLSLADLTMKDFEGLEFDLTDDKFFKRIEGYGIELIPIKGHSVKIPGYGENNGYYSENLSLVLAMNDFKKIFDIEECQVVED